MHGRAFATLIAAKLLYDTAAAALLAAAGSDSGLGGVGLWPAVVLHTALAGWGLACLRGQWLDLVK